MISRRTLLIGGALSIAAAAGAAPTFVTDAQLFRSTLTRLLGDFAMSDSEMVAFAAAFRREWPERWLLKVNAWKEAEFMWQQGPARELGFGPARTMMRQYERRLATSFLLWTNYLSVRDPAVEQIVCDEAVRSAQAVPCGNPFAVFES